MSRDTKQKAIFDLVHLCLEINCNVNSKRVKLCLKSNFQGYIVTILKQTLSIDFVNQILQFLNKWGLLLLQNPCVSACKNQRETFNIYACHSMNRMCHFIWWLGETTRTLVFMPFKEWNTQWRSILYVFPPYKTMLRKVSESG